MQPSSYIILNNRMWLIKQSHIGILWSKNHPYCKLLLSVNQALGGFMGEGDKRGLHALNFDKLNTPQIPFFIFSQSWNLGIMEFHNLQGSIYRATLPQQTPPQVKNRLTTSPIIFFPHWKFSIVKIAKIYTFLGIYKEL